MANLQVLVAGRPVDVYSHKGDQYIEGRKNSEFTLKITNPYGNRVKAVISVDGICVVDGKPASKDSTGYVIGAYGTITVDGWRIDNNGVRAFKFTDVEQSYTVKSGNGENSAGVIAVRLYQEKVTYRPSIAISTFPLYGSGVRSFNTSAPVHDAFASMGYSAGAVAKSANLSGTMDWMEQGLETVATGQGQHIESRVQKIDFDSNAVHSAQYALYYDTLKGLERRGVPINRYATQPNPFPGDGCDYCKSF